MKVTDDSKVQIYSTVGLLSPGDYSFSVTVNVEEDQAREDLSGSIIYFEGEKLPVFNLGGFDSQFMTKASSGLWKSNNKNSNYRTSTINFALENFYNTLSITINSQLLKDDDLIFSIIPISGINIPNIKYSKAGNLHTYTLEKLYPGEYSFFASVDFIFDYINDDMPEVDISIEGMEEPERNLGLLSGSFNIGTYVNLWIEQKNNYKFTTVNFTLDKPLESLIIDFYPSTMVEPIVNSKLNFTHYPNEFNPLEIERLTTEFDSEETLLLKNLPAGDYSFGGVIMLEWPITPSDGVDLSVYLRGKEWHEDSDIPRPGGKESLE